MIPSFSACGVLQSRSLGPVKLGDYWLDKYEVTDKQFKEFIDQTRCDWPAGTLPLGTRNLPGGTRRIPGHVRQLV